MQLDLHRPQMNPQVEKFNQTLFRYFGMLLLCLMVKMFELKELCPGDFQ